jgi:hypothetical protein
MGWLVFDVIVMVKETLRDGNTGIYNYSTLVNSRAAKNSVQRTEIGEYNARRHLWKEFSLA